MEEDVRLIIFGHTHEAIGELLPGGCVYINSGTWTWKVDLGGAGEVAWGELFAHPERFTDYRLLTYVRVDYDELGQPCGRLLEVERG
jgi:hypothetical protein